MRYSLGRPTQEDSSCGTWERARKAVVERRTENDEENHARGCRCGEDAFFEHAGARHIARNERDEACAVRANRQHLRWA